MLTEKRSLKYFIEKLFSLMLVVILISFTSCGSDDNEVETGDPLIDPPIIVIDPITISSHTPIVDNNNVNIASIIEVIFSESIESSGIEINFSLSNPDGEVTGTTIISNTELTFTPSELLKYSTEYTVAISSNPASEREIVETNWVFTTKENDVIPEPSGLAFYYENFATGDLSGGEEGFAWKGYNGTQVVTNFGHGDTNSLRFKFGPDASGEDSSAEQRFDMGRSVKEFWVEYWIYFPDGSEADGGASYYHRNDEGADNNKILRVWNIDYGLAPKVGASTHPQADGNSYMINEYRQGTWGSGNYESGGEILVDNENENACHRGSWNRLSFHVKLASVNNDDGVMEWWINGKKAYSNNELISYPPGGSEANWLRNGYLMGWSNSGFTDLTYIYIDDVSFYDTNPDW